MSNIIEINNLGKRYPLRHEKTPYGTLRDSLVNFLKNPLASRIQKESFWALDNINLKIETGDIVGIIGRNGAGKSTLLKIISGITKPTTGNIKLWGRVSSLLEVGTGFHPELTGRENIFLNGVILGMTRREVARKFHEIVAFAGVEKFLDTPVKRYSSGMYVRLAFAIAAHLEPDILIVDEVLAVGDAEFQKKCLGKMNEVSKKEGRTVLFVSHNLGTIRNLCQKGVFLENGRLRAYGPIEEVIGDYTIPDHNTSDRVWSKDRPGDQYIQFCSVRLLDPENKPLQKIHAEEAIGVEIEYEILEPVKNLQVGFYVRYDSQIIFESGDLRLPEDSRVTREKGRHVSRCLIPPNTLNSGLYSFTFFSHIPFQTVNVKLEDVLNLKILTKTMWSGCERQQGPIRLDLKWQIDKK